VRHSKCKGEAEKIPYCAYRITVSNDGGGLGRVQYFIKNSPLQLHHIDLIEGYVCSSYLVGYLTEEF
jgi:hypothetical protein